MYSNSAVVHLDGENILHHTSSHIILADADDKAVLPCRPSNDGTEVKLFIGRSLLKQREVSTKITSLEQKICYEVPQVSVSSFGSQEFFNFSTLLSCTQCSICSEN